MKYLSFMVLLLLVCLWGCQKPTEVIQKKYEGKSHISYSVDPANSNNPYDSAGILHNNGLDYVIERRESIPPCDTNEYKVVLDSLLSAYNTSIQSTAPSYINTNDPTTLQNDFWNSTRFLGPSGTMDYYSVPTAVKNPVLDILNIVKLSLNNYSSQQVVDSIKNYETTIINNLNLTTLQKKKILVAASVARYSFVYWTDMISDTSNLWFGKWFHCNNFLKNGTGFPNRILEYSDEYKAGAVVAADVVGTLAGGGCNVAAGATYSAAVAIYCWWDDVVATVSGWFDWLF